MSTIKDHLYININLFLSQKRIHTDITYRSFLLKYFDVLYDLFGEKELEDYTKDQFVNCFDKLVNKGPEEEGKVYSPATIRVYRYALRSFLQHEDIILEPGDLASMPWAPKTGWYIAPATYYELLMACETAFAKDPELCLDMQCVIALSYHCGLTAGEILSLTHSKFLNSEEGLQCNVHIEGQKDSRKILIGDPADGILLRRIDPHKTGPLLLFGHETLESRQARERQLRRLMVRVSKEAFQNEAEPITVKALRTSCIYSDIFGGRNRKEICAAYGITEFYISHALQENKTE